MYNGADSLNRASYGEINNQKPANELHMNCIPVENICCVCVYRTPSTLDRKKIIAVIDTTFAVVKSKPEKIWPVRDSNPMTSAIVVQRSTN